MPVFYFECPVCKMPDRMILSPSEAKGDVPCRTEGCSGKLKRTPKPPSTQITETLDNGMMARKLERLAEAETIHHERAHGKKGVI